MPICYFTDASQNRSRPKSLYKPLAFLIVLASGLPAHAGGHTSLNIGSAVRTPWKVEPAGGEWRSILVPAGGWEIQRAVLQLKVSASKDGIESYREHPIVFGASESEQAMSTAPAAIALVQRESTEWLDITVAAAQDESLPRVLLIGDSITRLYYPKVQELLKGKANVARLSTSKSAGDPALIDEIAMLLKQYHFDVIQVNNGMHGWDYTEEQYAAGLKKVHDVIRTYAPDAKIVVASTTPVLIKGNLARLDPKTERVRKRNLAVKAAFRDAVSYNDLFSLMLSHPEDYTPDGVHPSQPGAELEAAQVVAVIQSFLP